MDGGVGDGQRRGVGVIPARLYRVELAILGGRWVTGSGGVGDILYQRPNRRDGMARGHDDRRGSIGATKCAYYLGGV
jgi:hypothetical protein